MIIHTLKMCCILNPFFTEMPARRQKKKKKKVPSQRAVPPVQLSHQPLKQISAFVCLSHECKLTLMFAKCCSEGCGGYKPKLLWAAESCPSKGCWGHAAPWYLSQVSPDQDSPQGQWLWLSPGAAGGQAPVQQWQQWQQ